MQHLNNSLPSSPFEVRIMEPKELFEERRSHRYYTEGRVIPKGTLQELFRLTSLAPSAYNLQPWEFLLLQEPTSKQKLHDNGCPQPQVLTSSAMLIVLGNKEPLAHGDEVLRGFVEKGYFDEHTAQGMKANIGKTAAAMDALERRVWTMRSCVLACQQLMLAATALGIDTGAMEGFDEKQVRAAFKIPDEFEIVMLISMGYRAKELLPRLPRRDYDAIVHEEKF